MQNKVELLAPAGDFECFMAAINAGADAVYLGGNKFGARAYANNFSTEEIIEAIKVAHLFSKKIYLTVNTLVKESEIDELVPFMTPLVDAGLDGVIVQDLGVFFTLRENFSTLELHASTQMTITGIYGAKYLKEIGATRIVPARELSLDEIKDIKNQTGLEVETFIHGAMCYAYSGQCLFSSILGGRSGNRGRCAGPCRLPYKNNNEKNEIYPLSLKDMYTLNAIPKLIDAGIDSFKIEGRMKSPEYVAGVTSMYRKYIDMYLNNPDKPYSVSKEDENLIRNLYIRSDICEGYYYQHNNKSMVTIHEPGYKGCDQSVLTMLKEKYLNTKPYLLIDGKAYINSGAVAKMELVYKDIHVEVSGDMVTAAMNRPLLENDIYEKLNKTGNTFFRFNKLRVDTDNNSFMPVKALNELRRCALEKLENEILTGNNKVLSYDAYNPSKVINEIHNKIFASVSTFEQLSEVINNNAIAGVYINSDLLLTANTLDSIKNIIKSNPEKDFYISLPPIFRKRSYKYMDSILNEIKSNMFKGVLVKNMEEYIWLRDNNYSGEIVSDYSVYTWNKKALEVLQAIFTRTTMPVELNKKEILDIKTQDREMVLYTRLPLMYSANCVQKTLKNCLNDVSGKQNIFYLNDRHNNTIPIVQNCYHCFNTLYNPVVMSLHNQMDSIKKSGIDIYRLDFTLESKNDVKRILDFYENLILYSAKDEFPIKDYTAGHYKRGVE